MAFSKTTHILQLPEELQARIMERLQEALLEKKYGSPDPDMSTFAEDVERGMNGRICDIEELVPSEWILEDPENAAILASAPEPPVPEQRAAEFPSPGMLRPEGAGYGYESPAGSYPLSVKIAEDPAHGDWFTDLRLGGPESSYIGMAIHESFEDAFEAACRHAAAECESRGVAMGIIARDGRAATLERARASFGGRFDPPAKSQAQPERSWEPAAPAPQRENRPPAR